MTVSLRQCSDTIPLEYFYRKGDVELCLRLPLLLLLLVSTPSLGVDFPWFHRQAKSKPICLKREFVAAIEVPLDSVVVAEPRFADFTPYETTPVALAQSALAPSARTIAVPEGKIQGAAYDPASIRFLSTSFLDSCVGVAIYDPVARVGSLGHFVNIGDMSGPMTRYDQFAHKLQSEILNRGGNSKRVRITLVWGNRFRRAGERQLELLSSALHIYFPGVKMQIDNQIGNGPRSMVLDLWDGRTLETTQ